METFNNSHLFHAFLPPPPPPSLAHSSSQYFKARPCIVSFWFVSYCSTRYSLWNAPHPKNRQRLESKPSSPLSQFSRLSRSAVSRRYFYSLIIVLLRCSCFPLHPLCLLSCFLLLPVVCRRTRKCLIPPIRAWSCAKRDRRKRPRLCCYRLPKRISTTPPSPPHPRTFSSLPLHSTQTHTHTHTYCFQNA